MSSQSLANAVRKRYRDEVLCVNDVPTQFDNQDEDEKFVKPTNSIWVRCTLLESVTTQTDICNTPRIRTLGNVIFNVFTPVGQGDKEARELADLIANKYRIVTADGVLYRVPTINLIGRDGQWWQVNVTCPFQFDEIVTQGDD